MTQPHSSSMSRVLPSRLSNKGTQLQVLLEDSKDLEALRDLLRDRRETEVRRLVVACKEGSPEAFFLGGVVSELDFLLGKGLESQLKRELGKEENDGR